MNDPITVQLTGDDIQFLKLWKRDVEEWQFLHRGGVRTTDGHLQAESELRFINRLLAQIP